jgi:hypothetical protein
MTRFLSLAGSLLVSMLWIGSAFADPVTPSWPPVGIQHGAIDPARIALAHKIFDVAGKNYIEILAPNASLGFRMSLSHVLNEQDEVRRKVLAESIDAVFARVRPWTENEVVATIAENFSVDQLKDIFAFATTPTGKVLIERMPWIVSQSLGAEMFQMHEIIRDVENVYCAKVTCTPSERAVFAKVNIRSAPMD